MSDFKVDVTFRDAEMPNIADDGLVTFIGLLRKYFPRWCENSKAYGLSKAWGAESTVKNYASDYRNKIIPLLDPNKSLAEYEEEDFDRILDSIYERYSFKDSTMEHYRYLLWIVYRAGYKENLYPDRIFWEDVYNPEQHSEAENEAHKVEIRTRMRKSLSRAENLAIIRWFRQLDPETVSGEDIGLLFMYFCGTRNNEACGINFGHIYCLKKYKDLPLLDIVQTTEIGSSKVKEGGKTINAPRVLLLFQEFMEFLEKRRQFIAKKVASSEFELPEECKGDLNLLPVVCKGNSYGKRCTTKDLSAAGRELFEMIGISKGELAELHRMLRSREFADIGEKEVTTYLLRRNFATILHILGFSEGDLQYYIGHSVEDPDTERKNYTNKDKLLDLQKKLAYHPIYAGFQEKSCDVVTADDVSRNRTGVSEDLFEVSGDEKGGFFLDVDAEEPGDDIELVIEAISENAEDFMRVFDVSVDVQTCPNRYSKTVNVRRLYLDKYELYNSAESILS